MEGHDWSGGYKKVYNWSRGYKELCDWPRGCMPLLSYLHMSGRALLHSGKTRGSLKAEVLDRQQRFLFRKVLQGTSPDCGSSVISFRPSVRLSALAASWLLRRSTAPVPDALDLLALCYAGALARPGESQQGLCFAFGFLFFRPSCSRLTQ